MAEEGSAQELMEQLHHTRQGRQSQAVRMHRARVRGTGLVSDSSFLPELLDRRQNVISCCFHSKEAVKV